MNRNDNDTLTLLRTLDAAPASPSRGLSDRAYADLDRIVASGPTVAAPASPTTRRTPTRSPRRSRRVRRVLLGGAVATMAAAAVIALPDITGGDKAFASWTPTATTLNAVERADAADQCRASQENGASQGYESELAAATPAVSEQRGVWTTVLLAGPDGFTALCVTDESTRLFGDMFGSIGTPGDYRAPQPNEVIATDLGTGSMNAGELSLAAGYTGTNITGISYDSPVHGTVTATVSEGHFALWLPGNDFTDASRNGVTVTLTHTDGTTTQTQLHLAS